MVRDDCSYTFAGIEFTFLIIPSFSLDSSSPFTPMIVYRPTAWGSSLNSIHRLRLRRAVRYHPGSQHFDTCLIFTLLRLHMDFQAIRISIISLLSN